MQTPSLKESENWNQRLLFLGGWILFFSVFSSASGIGVGTALIGLFGLIVFRARLREAPKLPLFWPILSLIAAVLISIALAKGTGFSKSALKMRYFGVYFLLVFTFASFPAIRGRILRAAVPFCILLAVVACLQFFGLFDPLQALGLNIFPAVIPQSNGHFFHARGFLYHHNPFGFGAVLLFQLMLGQALSAPSRRGRAAFAVGAFACLVAVLASCSRGAWLSLAISTVAVFVVAGRKHWKAFLAIGLAATIASLALGSALKQRFETIRPDANHERIRLWTICVQIFEHAPVFGVGYHHGFELNRESYMTPAEKASPTFPTDPHSVYFDLLATTGLAGLLSFLWMLGAALALFLRGLARVGIPGAERGVLLAGLGALLCFAIGSAFDSHLFHTETMNAALFFLALGQSVVFQYGIAEAKDPARLRALRFQSA